MWEPFSSMSHIPCVLHTHSMPSLLDIVLLSFCSLSTALPDWAQIFRHTLPGKHLQQWSSPKHLWCWAMTSFNTFLNSWRGGYALLTGAAGSIPRKRLELLIHNVRELTLFCLLWFLFVCFWATTGGGQSISWLCTQQSFSVDSGDHVKCLMTLEYLDEPQLAPSLL